ncbi:MAG: NAD(P)-dependent oxidoreductase, partial [Chloroflexota bacterium]
MRIAVTGAAGRLGSAIVARLDDPTRGPTADVLGWARSDFDLDAPEDVSGRIAVDRPALVIHAAAWTDVDGCARDPELALRRNGEATATLARACAGAGVSMLLVSTNEVFDGDRTDRRGYRPDDPVNPPNAYGRSKLAGEVGAAHAFGAAPDSAALGIVRTSWLFGPGKPDFPAKIVAAARAAAEQGVALRLVTDEFGAPTYVPDLADAIARLAAGDVRGIHHVVNAGLASRADWARDVLERVRIQVPFEEVSVRDFSRPSTPPRWGVLEPTALPGGPLRHWRDAMADRFAATG